MEDLPHACYPCPLHPTSPHYTTQTPISDSLQTLHYDSQGQECQRTLPGCHSPGSACHRPGNTGDQWLAADWQGVCQQTRQQDAGWGRRIRDGGGQELPYKAPHPPLPFSARWLSDSGGYTVITVWWEESRAGKQREERTEAISPQGGWPGFSVMIDASLHFLSTGDPERERERALQRH